MNNIRNAYVAAAESAVELLAHPDVAASWHQPSALQLYDVGGIAGHLAGQIFVIEEVLAGDWEPGEPLPLIAFYDQTRWLDAEHDHESHIRIRNGGAEWAEGGPERLAVRRHGPVAVLRALSRAERAPSNISAL